MGQTTTGFMLGRKQRYSEAVENDLDKAKIPRTARDWTWMRADPLGSCTRSARVERRCAYLDKPLTLSEIPDAFSKHKAKARARWDKFAALVRKAKCTNKDPARVRERKREIILVQTEVG